MNLNNEYMYLTLRSGFPDHMVPKIFKIGQKLTKIWPKNRFFKSTDIRNPFSGHILVNFCPILKNLVPL